MTINAWFTRINKQHLAVIFALSVSFIIRIYLSQYDGYWSDVLAFKQWSHGVYYNGILNFYSSTPSDYPPFYIYILWIVGVFYKLLFSFSFNIDTTLFTILIKAPANIMDIVTSFLIFSIVKKYSSFRIAYLSMIFYAFNPAIIYDSAVWGQVDSVNTLFILLALMLIVSDKLELAGVSMAVAILTKPLSLVVLPFIAILMIKNQKPLRLIKIFLVSAFTFIALALPFFLKSSLYQLIKIYTSGYSYYSYNSLNAINLWALSGFWKSDETIFWVLSYRIWGYILFGLLFVYVAYLTIKSKDSNSIYFATAVLFFGFFMLFTRVHERYLFPMFAPLVIAASLNRRLNYVYWIMTLTFLFNLHFVLRFYVIPDGNPYMLLTLGINIGIFIYSLYCFSKSFGEKPLKKIKDSQ
jgi:dolichyl-phosphate-mannose-protein mannosyltransferase